MRAHHVHVEHDFGKSPAAVFSYLAEHENLAEVFGARVARLRDGDSGQRNGVGSRRQLKVGPLPAFEETVTEFTPHRRIEYRITKGSPLRGHVGTMEFSETAGGGTHMVYDIRIASALPGVARVVRAMLTRSIRRSLPTVERNA